MRITLKEIISYKGFIVRTSENGELALKMAEVWPMDVLITDINMPLMNGIELAREIHRHFPKVKIYFVTAYTSYQYMLKASELGYVMTKPINLELLIENLNK